MAVTDAEIARVLEALRAGETVTTSECSHRYVTTFGWCDGSWTLDCFEEGVRYVANLDEATMRAEIAKADSLPFVRLLEGQASEPTVAVAIPGEAKPGH